MAYQIKLNLPASWTVEQDSFTDEESGDVISHLEAHLRNDKARKDEGMVDIYVGDMPEGESAEDQAFVNYVETVGFSEDDPEDFQPISKIKFNNKNAWSFEALCEDESPMRFIAQEVKKGVLAIIVFAAPSDKKLLELHNEIERNFRVE